MRNTESLEAQAYEWYVKLFHFPQISPIMLMRKSGLNFDKCVKIIERVREMRDL